MFLEALAVRRQTRDRVLADKAAAAEVSAAAELTYQAGIHVLRSATETELEAHFPSVPAGLTGEEAWLARQLSAQRRQFGRIKARGGTAPDLPAVTFPAHPDAERISALVSDIVRATGHVLADPLN